VYGFYGFVGGAKFKWKKRERVSINHMQCINDDI
jgi:hypothetical protein